MVKSVSCDCWLTVKPNKSMKMLCLILCSKKETAQKREKNCNSYMFLELNADDFKDCLLMSIAFSLVKDTILHWSQRSRKRSFFQGHFSIQFLNVKANSHLFKFLHFFGNKIERKNRFLVKILYKHWVVFFFDFEWEMSFHFINFRSLVTYFKWILYFH